MKKTTIDQLAALTGKFDDLNPGVRPRDTITILGGELPKKPVYVNKKPRVPIDDRYVIYMLISIMFFMMLVGTMILTRQIAFVQHNLELHILAEPAQTASTPTVEVTQAVYPEPVSTVSKPQGLYIPPEASAFKTWMDYRKISDRSSAQWKLQQLCDTNTQGFREYDGCYIVAVGSFYSSNRIGKRLVITFDTGESIQAIVGDVKMDEDVVNGQYHKDNGNLIEFIVDKKVMDPTVLNCGDVSSLGLAGKVVSIVEVG